MIDLIYAAAVLLKYPPHLAFVKTEQAEGRDDRFYS
jgi:hypothetical protein